MKYIIPLVALAGAVSGQDALTLQDAIAEALQSNPSLKVSQALQDKAKAGIGEAHGGTLPNVDYGESWSRSDNPVFVFSSRLTQRQFAQGDLALRALNHPDFLNNFQSLLTVDQTLYDAGRTTRAIQAAELASTSAGESARGTQMGLIVQVARAYYAVLLGSEQLGVTEQARHSAEADLERAENRRAAGIATDADVLTVRVHLAKNREEQIQRIADIEVAQATLNDAMGVPLDRPHRLTTALRELPVVKDGLHFFEQAGVDGRPEIRMAQIAKDIAATREQDTRASYLPKVVAHGAFEADRQRFVVRGGANWVVSIGVRWNLFNGFADKARIAASIAAERQAAAERDRAESGVRLQVRQSWANLQAAQQRIETARAAAEEAEESVRIGQNRYGAGLMTISDLLRMETALLETRTRQIAAVHDQRVAALLLQFAAGTLSADSEVLQ